MYFIRSLFCLIVQLYLESDVNKGKSRKIYKYAEGLFKMLPLHGMNFSQVRMFVPSSGRFLILIRFFKSVCKCGVAVCFEQ